MAWAPNKFVISVRIVLSRVAATIAFKKAKRTYWWFSELLLVSLKALLAKVPTGKCY
jgi:hypothetical protein